MQKKVLNRSQMVNLCWTENYLGIIPTLVVTAIYFSITIIVSVAYYKQISFDPELIKKIVLDHAKVMAHTSYDPWQYRLLTNWIAEILSKTFIIPLSHYLWTVREPPIIIAYYVIYFSFYFLCLVAFHYYLSLWFSLPFVLIGTFILAFSMFFGSMFYHGASTDYPHLLFFIIGLIIIRNDLNIMYLYLLIFIGMFNRETIGVLPVVYLLYKLNRGEWKEALSNFFCISFIVVIVYGGVRFWIGPAPRGPLIRIWENLTIQALFNFLIIYNVFWILPWFGFSRRPTFLKNACVLVPLFIIIHLVFARVMEVRLFLPLACVLIPMGLMTLLDVVSKTYNKDISNMIA